MFTRKIRKIKGLQFQKPDATLLFVYSVLGFAFISLGFPWDKMATKWDCAIYISWVRDFPDILNNQINPYHLQKVLPSGMVNLLMRIFNVPISDENILLVFKFYNYSLSVIGFYFWLQICNIFKLKQITKVFTLVILVCNSHFTLWITSLPAVVDPTAYFLFTVILWAYFSRNTWFIYLLLLPAAFTWPSLIFFSFFLIIFPFKEKYKEKKMSVVISKKVKPILRNASILGSLFVLFFTIYQLVDDRYIEWCAPANFNDYTPFFKPLLYLSVFLNGLFIYAAFKPLFGNVSFEWLKGFFNQLFCLRFLFSAVLFFSCFIFIKFLIEYFSSDELPIVSGKRIVSSTFILPLVFPLSNILAHLIWYGPMIVFILFNYKTIFNKILLNDNHGLVLTITMSLVFAINPESRYSFNLILIFLLYLSLILDDILDIKKYLILCALSIGHLILIKYLYGVTYEGIENLNGPWISHENYLIAFGLFVFYLIIYGLTIKSFKNQKII